MPRKAPPPARRAERLPSAHGGMSRFAYARAKSAGVALDPIIKQAGLTRQQLDDPHATIAVRDQIKFLNLAAEALQDDLLGFHIAQTPDLRAFGLLYYLLAYTLATFGAFAVIIVLSRGDAPVTTDDLSGLWTVRPWLAVAMTSIGSEVASMK